MSPEVARLRRADHGRTCPFIGVKRSRGLRARNDAIDPGCVKTQNAWKRLEWSFSDRSKSNALTNFRDHNPDPTECLFYRSFTSPRFYTTKTHRRHTGTFHSI